MGELSVSKCHRMRIRRKRRDDSRSKYTTRISRQNDSTLGLTPSLPSCRPSASVPSVYVPPSCELRWCDEEGDLISINNDQDLLEPLDAVLSVGHIMKIEIGRPHTSAVCNDEAEEEEECVDVRYDRSQI